MGHDVTMPEMSCQSFNLWAFNVCMQRRIYGLKNVKRCTFIRSSESHGESSDTSYNIRSRWVCKLWTRKLMRNYEEHARRSFVFRRFMKMQEDWWSEEDKASVFGRPLWQTISVSFCKQGKVRLLVKTHDCGLLKNR